jgi:PTH2 family peptidyl-tRNA hydrolase
MLPKQIIIIRKDLNMRKGKIAAQASHASMKVILDLMENNEIPYDDGEDSSIYYPIKVLKYKDHKALDEWLNGAFTKIVVYVNSEQELLDLYQKAKDSNLLCALIQDKGNTEFHGVPTYTAVAVGPAYPDQLEPITGNLPLL